MVASAGHKDLYDLGVESPTNVAANSHCARYNRANRGREADAGFSVETAGTGRSDAKGEAQAANNRNANAPTRGTGADRFVAWAGQRENRESHVPPALG